MPVMKKKKAVMKQKAIAASRVSTDERSIMYKLFADSKTPVEVAKALGRDLSTTARHYKRWDNHEEAPKTGRPSALTPEQEKKVQQTALAMIEAADSEWQVTARMVKQSLKLRCCDRVILEALHKHGIKFHPMREKPVRTELDEKDRRKFAKDYGTKPLTFWTQQVHAYLDNKFFPVYLSGKARAYARKRRARGTFRARGQGLANGHVKPRKTLKQNFGKSVQVSVAICAQKVLTCFAVKGNWTANTACAMYQDALAPALRATYPSKRRFLLLEDNDTTGYKSNDAKDVKSKEKIDVLPLPKRSPDLNPLDYSFWSTVNTRMRNQERRYTEEFKESRAAFVARLRRTVLRVSPKVLNPMIRSMKRRCIALKEAKGRDFEE